MIGLKCDYHVYKLLVSKFLSFNYHTKQACYFYKYLQRRKNCTQVKTIFEVQIKSAMRTVENILDTKEDASNTIEPEAMVIDALKKLISVNLSYLVVMENGKFAGIFSERDYTRKLVLEGRSSRDTMVRDVMTTNLPVVSPSKSVEDCMYLMNTRGARYLAAFDDDEFEGIITIHDLLRQALASKHEVFDDTVNELINHDESGKVF